MATTDEEERINMDADMQVDSTILKLAEEYASLERRSKELNEEKKQIRKNADAIGISSLAWQIGVRTVKLMDKGERADFERGLKRVVSALADRQKELWPEEAERIRKRAEKAAEIPRTQAELDAATDASARSAPDAGGAKPRTGKPKPPAPNKSGKPDLKVAGGTDTTQTPPAVPDEDAEGEAVLNAGLAETNAAGKKKSQSAIAAEKAALAGTDKPLKLN